MIIALETGKPLSLTEVVALVREGKHTRAYLRNHSVCTVHITPKTIAKRDALLAALIRQGTANNEKTAPQPHVRMETRRKEEHEE